MISEGNKVFCSLILVFRSSVWLLKNKYESKSNVIDTVLGSYPENKNLKRKENIISY